MKIEKTFEIDPDFCPVCATLLSTNIRRGKSTCKNCQLSINLSDMNNINVGTIYFEQHEEKEKSQKVMSYGPSIQRNCKNCASSEMTFKTQQTKNADEPETVFYYCPNCGANEIENI